MSVVGMRIELSEKSSSHEMRRLLPFAGFAELESFLHRGGLNGHSWELSNSVDRSIVFVGDFGGVFRRRYR